MNEITVDYLKELTDLYQKARDVGAIDTALNILQLIKIEMDVSNK